MALVKSLALALLASTAASTGQWRDADTVAIPHSSPDSFSAPAARRDNDDTPLDRRATDRSPRRYIPSSVDCPKQRPSIRNGSSLSPQEQEWLPRRRNETVPHIRALLKRIAIPDFDSDRYLRNAESDPTALPNIGLAVSGGGYRAMLNGAGVLAAWDSRSDGSDAKGNLGGLLQSATYLSGLSGGGWLVGSIYTNNFTSVMDAVNSPNIWQFEHSILQGPVQYSLLQYYKNILDDVEGKKDANYDTSITDYWGRMLSYQLVSTPDGGPGFTFSSIADDPDFSSAKTPLPFIIADGRAPGENPIYKNTTIFEFSPWELGSSDLSLNGFVPLRYVGSKFDGGKLPDAEKCINGFDNVGFVMGTSSSLFNKVVLYLKDKNSSYVPQDVPSFIVDALTSVLGALGDSNNDIADWTPNPFKGWNRGRNLGVDSDRLTLVDGGEDDQNIPYHPHLVRDRSVDVVFSVDSSADTDSGWPDGASAMSTYRRSLETNITAPTSAFPVVPGKDTFLNLGLNTRPAFFGCNASNSSSPAPPLVVYLPNYPYVYASNISTFQMSISSPERDALVHNGWALATQLNATRDPDWPVCVGCAMLARSFDRTNTSVPAKCRQCFDKYCWDGRIDEATPQPYRPQFVGTPIKVESAGSVAGPSTLATTVLMAIGAAALALAL
ncbi:lysophospholipase catalytic domain-containing protein [Hirsutella rhossiliensis]|uniref:Lysophospholipase n=1 Tax=Hirsutella rhossiliensis TaxID=111463 RepID=A0A9P8N168_9HYPO|nr:lysophospholipase catalytic domain-containing protein [Hirsutella rhossiliensis]KAH0964702.1 lysophospholipase catalytic domain-containing protein [Hirsutella rhossiliensis]